MVLGGDLMSTARSRASLEVVDHRHEHLLVISLFPRLCLFLENCHAGIRNLTIFFHLLGSSKDQLP